MTYVYIVLWYLSGCLGSYLIWKVDAAYEGRSCPTPMGIFLGLVVAVMGTALLFAGTIPWIIEWIAHSKKDSWWARPIC